ncbi:uncharacterized protein LOC144149408 [Haemaphysalis longicornis]
MEVSGAVFNLDVAFEEYARQQAKKHGTHVSWTDCWHNHSHLKEHRLYKPYQVSLQAGRFWLEGETQVVRKPSVVYSHKYVNRQSSSIKAFAAQSLRREETTSFTTVKGFECNASSTFAATISDVIGLGTAFHLNVMLHKTNTETKTTTKTIGIDLEVRVPSKSEVSVEWHVTQVQKDIPWRLQVIASGYCAVWYDRKVEGHFLHFLPLTFLVGFAPELERVGPRTVSYTAEGVLSSVDTAEHNVFVKEVLPGNSTSRRAGRCKPKGRGEKPSARRLGHTG